MKSMFVALLLSASALGSAAFAGEDLDSKDSAVELMCRCRSYLKLRLRGPSVEAALGINPGIPRSYCPPVMPPQVYSQPQEIPAAPVYSPPQSYAPPAPQVAPQLVCPENGDILRVLAVLHFLANNDARRDSRRDADQGDLAALQVLQNQGRDVNREAAAILQILQNQATQINLSQAQTVLLQEIVAGMRAAVQQPPGVQQLPYPPPSSESPSRLPAPAPPPAPSYRSGVPAASGTQGRTFYRDTVYRR